jgi:hypothetical protein
MSANNTYASSTSETQPQGSPTTPLTNSSSSRANLDGAVVQPNTGTSVQPQLVSSPNVSSQASTQQEVIRDRRTNPQLLYYPINNNQVSASNSTPASALTQPNINSPLIDPANLNRLRAIHQRATALSGRSTQNASTDHATGNNLNSSMPSLQARRNISGPPLTTSSMDTALQESEESKQSSVALFNGGAEETNVQGSSSGRPAVDNVHAGNTGSGAGMEVTRPQGAQLNDLAQGEAAQACMNQHQDGLPMWNILTDVADHENNHYANHLFRASGPNVYPSSMQRANPNIRSHFDVGNAHPYLEALPSNDEQRRIRGRRCDRHVEDLLRLHIEDPQAVQGLRHGRVYADDLCPYCGVRARYHKRLDEAVIENIRLSDVLQALSARGYQLPPGGREYIEPIDLTDSSAPAAAARAAAGEDGRPPSSF